VLDGAVTETDVTTLDQLWQEFNRSDDARSKLSRDDLALLRRFVRWCGPNTTASTVTPYRIEGFLQKQLSSTTLPPRAYLPPLKLFFTFASDRGTLTDNPMRRVRLPRGQGRAARAAGNQEDSVLLTEEKLTEFQAELERLQEEERPRILRDLSEARADGDLRENAAYDDAKKQQGMIEGRIRELEQMIRRAELLGDGEQPTGKVVVGSLVELESPGSRRRRQFRIVSPEETDPRNGKLSFQSPVGQGVMGRSPGETVEVETPRGVTHYRIVSVS
jgi:transcription elongation factor GreA